MTDWWAARQYEADRCASWQRQLAHTCGCVRCGDADRADELAALIRHSTELIQAYETALMDGAHP